MVTWCCLYSLTEWLSFYTQELPRALISQRQMEQGLLLSGSSSFHEDIFIMGVTLGPVDFNILLCSMVSGYQAEYKQ